MGNFMDINTAPSRLVSVVSLDFVLDSWANCCSDRLDFRFSNIRVTNGIPSLGYPERKLNCARPIGIGRNSDAPVVFAAVATTPSARAGYRKCSPSRPQPHAAAIPVRIYADVFRTDRFEDVQQVPHEHREVDPGG
ncbi:hypothetical protein [Pseudomonas citronellolis]|uniref:hypothetical protein n=1 Tax=Pseudomonas citronellolis TaxID=53408 RepID=UPI0021C250BA|nr:hypothetical protein [Pseudomonas citronellolis]UXJ50856.1 hypothetical protein N5P21_23110 [Pseudomonas citronellolis]